MKPQTYAEFTKAVGWYLEREYPAAALAVAQGEQASSAAAAIAIARFMSGDTITNTAGDIAAQVVQRA